MKTGTEGRSKTTTYEMNVKKKWWDKMHTCRFRTNPTVDRSTAVPASQCPLRSRSAGRFLAIFSACRLFPYSKRLRQPHFIMCIRNRWRRGRYIVFHLCPSVKISVSTTGMNYTWCSVWEVWLFAADQTRNESKVETNCCPSSVAKSLIDLTTQKTNEMRARKSTSAFIQLHQSDTGMAEHFFEFVLSPSRTKHVIVISVFSGILSLGASTKSSGSISIW